MGLNRIVAALLVIFVVLFSLVVVLTWSVEANLLNADVYVRVLDEAGLFEVPYALIRAGQIPHPGGLLLEVGPFSALSGADLEMAARELAPPDWLHAQLEEGIRDLMSVTQRSESGPVPDLTISLRTVKVRALGEPGERALTLLVQTLPVCAPGRAPLSLDSDTPVCVPADLDVNAFVARLKVLLVPLVARIPDTYRVTWQPEQRAVLEDLREAGRTLDRLQFALWLLAALNVALMGLIWLLVVRSPAEWLRWTGVPLLILGLLALFVAVVAPRVVLWAAEGNRLRSAASTPELLVQVLDEAIQNFVPLLFRRARLAGGAMAVSGLLLTLISVLFPGSRRRAMARAPRFQG